MQLPFDLMSATISCQNSFYSVAFFCLYCNNFHENKADDGKYSTRCLQKKLFSFQQQQCLSSLFTSMTHCTPYEFNPELFESSLNPKKSFHDLMNLTESNYSRLLLCPELVTINVHYINAPATNYIPMWIWPSGLNLRFSDYRSAFLFICQFMHLKFTCLRYTSCQ